MKLDNLLVNGDHDSGAVDDGFRLKTKCFGYVAPVLGEPMHFVYVSNDNTEAIVFRFVVNVGCWNVGIRNILSILLVDPEFNHGWVCDGEG